MTGPLIVIGDVITDVLVQTEIAIARGTDTRATIAVRAGGSAANQAAWLATQRSEIHFVGRVGTDPFGVFQIDELRRVGVIPHVSLDSGRATGLIVVLVEMDGTRTMLAERGANLALSGADLPRDLFQPGAAFHYTGYSIVEPGPCEAALAGVGLARRHGMTCSVDPSSSSFLAAFGPERFLALTRGADLCFPNLDEGSILTGCSEPEDIGRRLAESYGEVALKLGERGALWVSRRKEIVTRPAEPGPVVDTTGAGDAFCAGFLARRLAGGSAEASLAAGLRLAATAVAHVGARPEPTAKSVPPWG